MAIANFFDKAALGAAHALRDFDFEGFVAALDAAPVGVAFDGAAVRSPESRDTLELAVNLLARLYPRIALVPLDDTAAGVTGELASSARAINPDIELIGDLSAASAVVVVGTSAVNTGVPTVYAGSDGWIVRLSPREPVGSAASGNPFGAAAAACFAVANIFRVIFARDLPGGAPDDAFALSLLDLTPNASSPINAEWTAINIGECFLVGAGAIGNAAAWALSRADQLHGTLHVVDHEAIDTGNLQRYVLAGQGEVGAPKAAVAAAAFGSSSIEAEPFVGRWGHFLAERGDWRLARVAVAVDSARDRQAVQAALPRWIVNGWTQPGDLGVSRHPFLDQACLACLYLDGSPAKNEDQLVAEAIGLPGELMEVRQRLATATPVDRVFLERVAAALGVPVEPLLAFEGAPLRTFYSGAVCGGLVLRLGGNTGLGTGEAAVPMAFQSALAGILLAAELVAHAGGVREGVLPAVTRIDLLRPLGATISTPAAKHASGRCMCQDADYIAAYKIKYET